jgi:hypothetical protein
MYAKLAVKLGTTPTIGAIMQEIAQVCTGTISNQANLAVFDTDSSEIISSTATNWQLFYPAAFTANTNVYILRSQCATTSKYKYARLLAKGTATNEPFTEPLGGNANVYAKTTYTNTFIEMDSCATANSSTGAVTNATYYHQSNEGYTPGSRTLYLSASTRHLLMYSEYNASTNIICTFGVFEYPETNITSSKTLIPAIAYRGRGGALTVTTTSRETAAAPGYSVIQIPDGYTANTAAYSLLGLDATTAFNTFEFSQTYTGSNPNGDRAFTKTTIRQQIPRDLVFYDIARSHNFINASTLSNVFYLPGITTGTVNSTYTAGNVTYAAFPTVASTILVPRA